MARHCLRRGAWHPAPPRSPADPADFHHGLRAWWGAVLLVVGCAGGPPPVGPPAAAPGAAADDARRALLLLLADQRLFEPVTAEAALAGGPALRAELALALGRAGDVAGRQTLELLLADRVVEVRREAALALGRLGDDDAARALSRAARDPDPVTGELAVEALARLGVPLEEVVRELDGLPAGELERRLVPSLFAFPSSSALPWAERGLELADARLRARAAYALARDAVAEAAPALRRLLADGDPWVRGWAARGLGEVGGRGDLELLRPLLDDGEPGPVVQALRAAGRLIESGRAAPGPPSDAGAGAAGEGDRTGPEGAGPSSPWWKSTGPSGGGAEPSVALPLLDNGSALTASRRLASGPAALASRPNGLSPRAAREAPVPGWRERLLALVADPRPGVRLTALQTAGAWLLDEPLGVALEARARSGLADEAAWAEGGAALAALAAGGDPRAADLARLAAESPWPARRAAAATAAARLGDRDLLAALAADSESVVRLAALAGLLDGGGGEEAPVTARQALADADPGVRAAALEWLIAHPVAPVEELFAALAVEGARRFVELRWNAAAALGARAAAEPLERGQAVRMLERLAADRHYAVRLEAAERLAALGRPRPAAGPAVAGRGVAYYRQLLERSRGPREVELETRRGTLRLRLDCPRAPLTCVNFLQLAGQGFYDGLTLHRVIPDFVVQGGDPRGDGWGGPGYTLRDEPGARRFERGVLGMARAAPHTAGSQFFITLSPQPHLDGRYTAFGRVVDGDEALDRLLPGDRILALREVPLG